jgi:hypothetical protein
MRYGWYKMSAILDDLTNTIVIHLQKAKNAFNDASLHDAITNRMQGVDQDYLLNSAINKASMIISSQQGGMLTPSQQQMIASIRARNENILQNSEPNNLMQTPDNQSSNLEIDGNIENQNN